MSTMNVIFLQYAAETDPSIREIVSKVFEEHGLEPFNGNGDLYTNQASH